MVVKGGGGCSPEVSRSCPCREVPRSKRPSFLGSLAAAPNWFRLLRPWDGGGGCPPEVSCPGAVGMVQLGQLTNLLESLPAWRWLWAMSVEK